MRLPDEQVMVFRGFCEHGKVRALMTEVQPDDSPEMVKEKKKDRRYIAGHAHTTDVVNVIQARKSDMKCAECDAKRKTKRRAA